MFFVFIDDLDGKITPLEQITIQPKKVNAKKITGFQVILPNFDIVFNLGIYK